jgi:cell division initiation protein
MPYTPVELRHVRLGRSLFGGYKRAEVDTLMEEVADSFEEVWRERAELADRVEDLERQLEGLHQREQLLAQTLVSAEKAAADAKEQASREAELIVAEAHQEARSIMRAGQSERERLFAEVRRVQALLRSALGMVDEADRANSAAAEGEGGDAGAGGGEQRENWPRREDTREFGRASLFVPPDQDAQAG